VAGVVPREFGGGGGGGRGPGWPFWGGGGAAGGGGGGGGGSPPATTRRRSARPRASCPRRSSCVALWRSSLRVGSGRGGSAGLGAAGGRASLALVDFVLASSVSAPPLCLSAPIRLCVSLFVPSHFTLHSRVFSCLLRLPCGGSSEPLRAFVPSSHPPVANGSLLDRLPFLSCLAPPLPRSSHVALVPCLACPLFHSPPISFPNLVLPTGRFCARVVRCCANSIMPVSSPPPKKFIYVHRPPRTTREPRHAAWTLRECRPTRPPPPHSAANAGKKKQKRKRNTTERSGAVKPRAQRKKKKERFHRGGWPTRRALPPNVATSHTHRKGRSPAPLHRDAGTDGAGLGVHGWTRDTRPSPRGPADTIQVEHKKRTAANATKTHRRHVGE